MLENLCQFLYKKNKHENENRCWLIRLNKNKIMCRSSLTRAMLSWKDQNYNSPNTSTCLYEGQFNTIDCLYTEMNIIRNS